MTDRAEEIARGYRERHLLNVTLALAGKREGALREACDAAEKAFAAALRSYATEERKACLALVGNRIRAMRERADSPDLSDANRVRAEGVLMGYERLEDAMLARNELEPGGYIDD